MKLDFWSYAFEDKHPLYKNNAASGGELRTWWLKTLRNALPRDGYLEVACDLCQGNPFMGQYINNHRYGIDIADGRWEHIKTNYLWGAANLACHTGDLIIPNSDSIGIFPDLNDSEMLFLVNYCIATHTLVEISGLLSKCGDQKRLAILKKAACNPNNGQPVHFAQYDYRSRKYAVPEIMYFTTPHFSTLENNAVLPLRTVGIFNINDEEKTYSFTTTDIGLESGSYTVVDVWTGEMCELDGFEVTLPPHASALLAISRRDSVLIHDADLRITSAEALPNGVAFVSDYGVKSAHITLARSAKSVTLDGQPLDFAAQGNTITLDIPHSGRLEITFDARVKGFCKATTRQIMSESCCACR